MQVDTTSDSLKGKYAINKEGKIQFIEGAITKAMKKGAILLIEEINFLQPECSSIMYSATDHNRNIILDEKEGETIKAHPQFRIIGTRNPEYTGTCKLNAALENRFTVQIELDYLNQINEKKLITKRYKTTEENAELITRIAEKIRTLEGEFDNDLSTRVIETTAKLTTNGINIKDAIEITIIPIIAKEKETKTKAKTIIETVIQDIKAEREGKEKKEKQKEEEIEVIPLDD